MTDWTEPVVADVTFRTVVVDACAAIEVLLRPTEKADRVSAVLDRCSLCAPVVFPFEVSNVIRRRLSARLLSPEAAELAWTGLDDLDVDLWQWATIARRVWRLKGSLSTYDASYIALAEVLDCPLVTTDAKLAAMAPPTCRIELIP